MQFEKFVEVVEPILKQQPEGQIPMLAELLDTVPIVDLATIIYLFQGRLGPPTAPLRRIKGWPTQSEILDRLTHNSKIAQPLAPRTNSEVYKGLRECIIFDSISRWSSDYLHRIQFIATGMSQESVSLIALIFAGGIFDDKTIIKAITRIGGGGVGASKTIASLYQKTIPDLGLIATSLRQNGYFDTVTLPPQFGTVVPREEIKVWESIEQAWDNLKPTEGLFIQAKFFDGIHVQIHKNEKNVKIFNIRGNEITSNYSYLGEIIRGTVRESEIIVDCEMIGFDPKTRRILPLHRIRDTRDHILAVFDILKLNGKDWRSKPYAERKAKLEELFGPIEFRKSGIYLPREELAKSVDDSKKIINSILDKPHFEGVIIKSPSGVTKSGSASNYRGRLKPYTIVDSILVGYNSKKKSFMVGLWRDEKKRSILPYRNVEGVRREIANELSKLMREKLTKKRPTWVGPGPAPDWYMTSPVVVAIKWDGFIVPNRGNEFAVKWLPHEGVTIAGIYPSAAKDANTLSRLYGLRKRDLD